MDTNAPEAVVLDKPSPEATEMRAPCVGIFDSGIGGFTVARAILGQRPGLNLVYFGDTINMPYGGRTMEQLASFARNSIEFLLEQGMDILAVGCNASNSALGQSGLKSFGIPSYDLVSSTIQWLKEQDSLPESIALAASEATIGSQYWQRKLGEAFPGMKVVPVPAPEFVPLVEQHPEDPEAIRAAVRKRLQPALGAGASTVLHGCTHYPLLESYMAEISPELAFIDPAECLARRLVASLAPPLPDDKHGELRLFSSLPGEAFHRIGERVFKRPIRDVTRMYIVNPHKE